MQNVLILALALAVRAADAPSPLDLFVAPGGSDDAPGTAEKPFRTIERARKEVAKRIAAGGLERDLTVYLRGGTYELAEPLRFGPEDSPGAGRAVTYAAYPGETPTLSGGRKITGWKRGPGELWAAEVPEARDGKWTFRQLFVNGERRQRARTPNAGFFRIEGPSPREKRFLLKFREGDLRKRWASDGDVEVIALIAWTEYRVYLREIDEAARIAVLSGKPHPVIREENARYYLENAPDGLDAPGEWRLDAKAGTVSYWPLPGEDLAGAGAVAPRLRELVVLEGDPGQGKLVRGIRFSGLTFRHTDWDLGPEGYAESQAAVSIGGTLRAVGARECAVEKCVFTNLGNYAVEFGRGCRKNRIAGNELFDLGAGGVKIGETAQRPSEAEQSGENEVTDNHLHDCGLVYPPAVGVWIGQSSGNTIAHNEIHDLYYTAISVGWTWGYGPNQCRGNLIEANHLHHVGKDMLSDMGGIYTLGVQPGTILRRNLIHDVSSFTYGGWGIYPDEGSSEILIEENVVYRCKSASFHQHYGRENVVRNNVFADGKEHQLMRSRAEPHLSFTMERNIIYFSEGSLLGSIWKDDRYRLDRNLYWKTGGGEVRFADWSFEEWKQRKQDENSLISDPLFVNPAARDYALKPDSPALKLGFKPIDLRDVGPRPGKRRG
jgi:hypothetical protein